MFLSKIKLIFIIKINVILHQIKVTRAKMDYHGNCNGSCKLCEESLAHFSISKYKKFKFNLI